MNPAPGPDHPASDDDRQVIIQGPVSGAILNLGESTGINVVGDGHDIVQHQHTKEHPPTEARHSVSQNVPVWSFRLEEEKTLQTKAKCRLSILPPEEGGREHRYDSLIDVALPPATLIAELPWYFSASREPGLEREREQKIQSAMARWGQQALEAILADPRAYSKWQDATQPGQKIRWEIIGSPAFHQIPWEWLQDGFTRLCLEQTLRRRIVDPPVLNAWQPENGPLSILWITARPGSDQISPEAVLAPVKKALGTEVKIMTIATGSYQEMLAELRRHQKSARFHLVHLDLHGTIGGWEALRAEAWADPDRWQLDQRTGGRNQLDSWENETGLLFFSDQGKIDPVTTTELGLEFARCRIPLVVMNACRSAVVPKSDHLSALAAHLVQQGGFSAVGFSQNLTVEGAGIFFEKFYRSLGNSPEAGSLEEAMQAGRLALHDKPTRHGVPMSDWHLPIWYAAQDMPLPARPDSSS